MIQPQRLALLARIACAEQGISRDSLMVLLWPESDTDRARNALNQALFRLREALPRGALAGSGVIRLNPDLISVDRTDFLSSIAAGRLDVAVSLYRGPFLHGFHLTRAAEFENWAQLERDRLDRSCLEALDRLTNMASAAGDRAAAIGWLRRRVAASPLESQAVLRLMRLLADAGDAPSALDVARAHAARVEAEFETAPDAAVLDLAAELRVLPIRAAAVVHSSESENGAGETSRDLTDPPVHAFVEQTVGASGFRPIRTRRLPRRGALAAGSVLAIVLSVARFMPELSAAPQIDTVRGEARIAVLPFAVSGSDDPRHLSEAFAHLLSRDLQGVGNITTVAARAVLRAAEDQDFLRLKMPARARRLEAQYLITGSVVESHGRLRAEAVVLDREGRTLARVRAASESGDLFRIADDLAARLVTPFLGGGRDQLARRAATTTTSSEAFRHYVSGEAEFRAGRYEVAVGEFTAATAADPAFALAQYRLSVALDWVGRVGALEAAAAAMEHADQLGSHERLILDGNLAWREGRFADAERSFTAATLQQPTDAEAWYGLAEVLFHLGYTDGRSISGARRALERVVSLDPQHSEAARHLLRLYVAEGDRRKVGRLIARLWDGSTPNERTEMQALSAALGSEQDRARFETTTLPAVTGSTLYVIVWRVAAFTGQLEWAEKLAARLPNEGDTPQTLFCGSSLQAMLQISQGRLRDAFRTIGVDRVPMPFSSAASLRYHLLLHPLLSDSLRQHLLAVLPAAAGQKQRLDSEACNFALPSEGTFITGLEALRAGDFRLAAETIRALETAPSGEGESLAASLRARALLALGKPAAALRELPSRPLASWPGGDVADRLTRAEAHWRQGHLEESLGYFGAFRHTDIPGLPFAAPAHYMRGRILEKLGRPRQAAEEYAAFIAAWKNADEELQPLVDQARGRRRWILIQPALADITVR